MRNSRRTGGKLSHNDASLLFMKAQRTSYMLQLSVNLFTLQIQYISWETAWAHPWNDEWSVQKPQHQGISVWFILTFKWRLFLQFNLFSFTAPLTCSQVRVQGRSRFSEVEKMKPGINQASSADRYIGVNILEDHWFFVCFQLGKAETIDTASGKAIALFQQFMTLLCELSMKRIVGQWWNGFNSHSSIKIKARKHSFLSKSECDKERDIYKGANKW